uniref:Uncharacterized protein n=1 Tax=Labrus bergylta TaxID=56723 RepID=A0A3Q3F365_9LABR
VVKSSSPVHGDIRLLRSTSGELAELKQAIEHGTVLSNVDSLHLLKLDVVITVVFGHLLCSGFVTYIDLHFPVESIVQQQVVSHPDTMWFHGMSLSIVVISDVTCKEKHALLKNESQAEVCVCVCVCVCVHHVLHSKKNRYYYYLLL